ncbi:hypothetical protein ACTXT7_000023 [Hymenolepis weldensis]
MKQASGTARYGVIIERSVTSSSSSCRNLENRLLVASKGHITYSLCLANPFQESEMPLVFLSRKRYQLIIILVISLIGIFYFNLSPCLLVPCKEFSSCDDTQTLSSEPLIFIGGYPRSGTTLMRVLLDVHPDVRCGPETHILPLILYLYSFKIKTMYNRLRMANITDELVDSIFIKAISTLIHEAGPPAGRLCTKDPFIDLCLKQLLYLYPNAKFILMVRDGRAVTQSVLRWETCLTMCFKQDSLSLFEDSKSMNLKFDGLFIWHYPQIPCLRSLTLDMVEVKKADF